MNYTRDKKILLTVYFLFYYAVFLFFWLDNRLLSQYQPIFFSYNRDLTELMLIATGLPRWLIAHPAAFTVLDVLAFLLPAALLLFALRKGRFSVALGIGFALFLCMYLLLADLFWQVHHEPFVLYVLLAGAWITNREDRFYQLLKGCRYYFLYVFTSAALWKIARGALFSSQEMSRILLFHHSDLLTGPCTSPACQAYRYLIDHPALSWWLYLAGVLLEGCFIVGFFTRRWDRLLIGLTLVFVVADLLLMRIPYWTILLGTVTLWLRSAPEPASPLRGASSLRGKKIIIYETTHHENLPALLDLCEAQFSEIAVFLKEGSYHHLSGQGSPEQRWSRTDFFVQPASCGNRRFIRQLFTFLRRHRYSHLHLSTLDNNLLVFSLRLIMTGPIHISLTVHEVNEYFSRTFRTIRAGSESIAKLFLHQQIRHYSFFLPSMVDQFRQRLPGATSVFIPSRFYSGHRTHPARPSDTPFTIVIPGSVDPNRRNYADIIAALSALKSSLPPIELVILGDCSTPDGARIIADLQQLETRQFRLRSYKGYIPESTYEEELAGAHLIWSPLNLHKKSSRNSPETYGLTTASGLTADLLLNNIPALVPAGFIIPDPFREALFTYDSPAAAGEIVHRLIQDPIAYLALREKIHLSFSWFTKENFSEAFEELMR